MLSFRTVLPNTLELLKRLMEVPELAGTRLVGGTALALQYGHRTSVDLDFFGSFDTDVDFFDVLSDVGDCHTLSVAKNIKAFEIDGVKVDIVNYKYPWIDDVVKEGNLRLASDKDIAAMKVNAIEGRGSRKDFVDIYFLLQHMTLRQILDLYIQKYQAHSLFRPLMSLMYFEDAEAQPLPKMFYDVSWEEMKKEIGRAVQAETKK